MTPEQQAREQIDAMLVASGWVIQDYKALNLAAGPGVAVREVPLNPGPCDYLLLVNRKPVGVIEAKRHKEHKSLSGADEPYEKLKRALRTDIDETAWSSLYSTVSRPIDKLKTGKIAIEVINHYRDEVLKFIEVK